MTSTRHDATGPFADDPKFIVSALISLSSVIGSSSTLFYFRTAITQEEEYRIGKAR
jgi:hypothetical protein